MKFILWCAFVFLVVLALRKKIKLWLHHQHHQHHQKSQQQRADAQVEMRSKHSEAMLACAYCGMYVPSSESIKHNDVVFCSVAHRQQYFST